MVDEMRRGVAIRKALEAVRARADADPVDADEVRDLLRGAMRVDPGRVHRSLDPLP